MIHKKLIKIQRLAVILPIFAGLCLVATSCDFARNQLKADRAADMDPQDFRDGMAPRLPDVDDKTAASAETSAPPQLQPYVDQTASTMKPMPLVSISVNQSVPLRDVLFELAQQADYDLELDPRIKGSVIFTARQRPFDEVVERLCAVAGLRYKFDNDVLRVELDTPYNKVYKIDYLSYIRTNKGDVRNDIGVVSGQGTDTGSSFEASTSSQADFWGELNVNIQQILGSAAGAVLKTAKDPRITATEQNPNVQAVAATDANGKPVKADKNNNVNVQPPEAVLHVNSLPIDEDATPANAPSTNGPDPLKPTFTMNKQAGLVNVYASEKAQKEVEAYLKMVRRAVTAQVLIEAKVLEVALDDEHATGIDWRALKLGDLTLNYLTENGADNLANLSPVTAPLDLASSLVDNGVAKNSNIVVGSSGDDFQALVHAISGFGTVRALASPRLTVLNNQSAVLNVANNRVFFDLDVDVTTNDNTSQVDINSDIRNVPEGVLINVQPSINLDNSTVAMAVRPTITRITNEKPDPAIQYITAANHINGVQSLVPELNVQEIDSVLQVRSGQAVVMGGLLQDRTESGQTGVPVASEVPIFGSLFKQHQDHTQKTELVIFLKATILAAPEDSVSNTDKDLYRSFSGDRRPLKL